MSQHDYALILAGGRGTRFWPRSRRSRSKQVLEFLGKGTLIQQTVERLSPAIPPERMWILTSNELAGEVARQLPQIPHRQILAEPVPRNTAPAIGLMAHILSGIDPKAAMGVFPADHFIGRQAEFRKLVKAAYKVARGGPMTLLGIAPRWAETGYGYLEFPTGGMNPGSLTPVELRGFREKPDLAAAKRYLKAGRYAWNAGMFFWRPDVILGALREHMPTTAALIDSLPAFGAKAFSRKLAEVFPQCESLSIDYGVLERSKGVVALAAGDIGWNDVGSFNAVYELLPRDPDGNTGRGEALILDSRGCFIDSPGRLVALLGVEDLVIVDTPDALLITRRDRAQDVGRLVKAIEKQGREDLL
jgi:mannose-1-phosphate guanylyltransferase